MPCRSRTAAISGLCSSAQTMAVSIVKAAFVGVSVGAGKVAGAWSACPCAAGTQDDIATKHAIAVAAWYWLRHIAQTHLSRACGTQAPSFEISEGGGKRIKDMRSRN